MIMYNGSELPEWCRVVNIVRNVKPPREVRYRDLNTNGAKFIKARDKPKRIRVQIRIYEQNKEILFNKIDELAVILHSNKPSPLVFKDRVDLYLNAITEGEFEIFETTQFGGVWVTFLCLDPYWYENITTHYDLFTDGIVRNYSSASTHWTATVFFTEPTNHYHIRLYEVNGATIDKRVVVNYQFQQGDRLQIDSKTRKITINDNIEMGSFNFMESTWFDIESGDNTFHLSNPTLLSFVKRWL